MGTRFLAAEECDIPGDYKKAILLATDTDTVVVRGKRAAHRDLKRELIERVKGYAMEPSMETEEKIVALFEEAHPGHPRPQREWKVQSAGQSAGLVHEILPAREIIQRIMAEARKIMAVMPGSLL